MADRAGRRGRAAQRSGDGARVIGEPGGGDLALVTRFARQSRRVRTADGLARLVEAAAASLGFDYVALVLHGPSPPASGLALVTYPAEWQALFHARRFDRDDPVQQACGVTAFGFRWDRLGELIRLTARQRLILRLSRRHGLGPGFTVPLHLPGAPPASCSFAVARGRKLPGQTLFAAQLVGMLAFEAARRLNALPVGRPLRLSPRQSECVSLLADGLTDKEIGNRLGLSEESVTKYLNAARRRHGFRRRAQLAAVARLIAATK